MNQIILDVSPRPRTGKGSARSARRAGLIPAVLYGGTKAPETLSVPKKQIDRALAQGGFESSIVQLSRDGQQSPVIASDIQFHPVTDEPIHIDLFRVEQGQTVRLEIPVRFTGQDVSPGIKRGGALNIVRRSIEVLVQAEAVPDELVCDVSEMNIGDNIKISSLDLPEGVTPRITDRDFTIATLSGRVAEAQESEEEEEAEIVDTDETE